MVDPADRSGEVLERAMEEFTRERAHRQSAGVSFAATGRRCADCGEPIDARRLVLVPDARRCATCQTKQETRG